ncbi:hypothetical protein CE91St43_21090 [Oscillospiraceae bacterium]|nr:hypothetical protein CE91St43_21090 [Oscillospiraceae bacterium]
MLVSARVLGQNYGLTAEEMNRVLVKQGFLQGTPGNYDVTQKALQYAVEKDFHRGTGGYACYNRYWTTRTFDDSIKDVLDVSAEFISEVRGEIAADRVARYAAQAAARARANTDFLAKEAAEKATREAAERAALETEELITKWKTGGKIGLAWGGVIILGYGIYKVAPKVKSWWNERRQSPEAHEYKVA